MTARTRLVSAAVATALLGALLTVPGRGAAVAEIPTPADDPFYAVPVGLADIPNGTVLASRRVSTQLLGLPAPATAWQVKYKTLDNQGEPTATVTTVLVPLLPWLGQGPRPALSFQVAEDAVADRCAPSYVLRTVSIDSYPTVEGLPIGMALVRGWTVTVPDYEGPDGQFGGADMSARGVLDGLRAARSFGPVAIADDAPLGLIGYSGGALATAWAAQLQPTYAPDVDLAGVATNALPADLADALPRFDRAPWGGFLTAFLLGLRQSYPELDVASTLTSYGERRLAQGEDQCILGMVAAAPTQTLDQLQERPTYLEDPQFLDFLRSISPVEYGVAPDAPVFDTRGALDEFFSRSANSELMARYCAAGVRVRHVELPADHFANYPAGAPGEFAWLQDRFLGKPAPTDC